MPQRHPLYIYSKDGIRRNYWEPLLSIGFTSATEGQDKWNARRNAAEKSTHTDGNVKP